MGDGRAQASIGPDKGVRVGWWAAYATLHAMRTTLDLDDQLMSALMARHPGETMSKAVETAIAEHVRRGPVDWLLENAGRVEIEDLSAELRAADRRV
jgi:hypothetical protein